MRDFYFSLHTKKRIYWMDEYKEDAVHVGGYIGDSAFASGKSTAAAHQRSGGGVTQEAIVIIFKKWFSIYTPRLVFKLEDGE
jgi:hypothetical protein